MNEKLQESLAVLIDKSVSGAEAGVAFLSAEIPDVVHQLLIWKASVSAISMTGFILLLYIIYRANKVQIAYWRKIIASEGSLTDHPESLMNMFQAVLIIPLVALFSMDWLKIMVAPKIYLIEYAASLVK